MACGRAASLGDCGLPGQRKVGSGEMSGMSEQHKTIFDDRFLYLKIPREVFDIPGLRIDERAILSRIVFWTRKGMPCTHTNEQFAELLNKSESAAKRVLTILIKRKLLDAHYRNNKELKRRGAHRDLTALVGVEPEKVFKRKAAQVARAKDKSWSSTNTPPGQARPGIDEKAGQVRTGTTTERTKKTTTAPSPLPARGQASAPHSCGEKRLKRVDLTQAEFKERKEQLLRALTVG